MRILVSLLLFFSACASNDKPEPPVKPPLFGGGTCNDAWCGAFYGTMLAITMAATPVSAADRRRVQKRITGTCDVQLAGVKAKEACGTIQLTITGASGLVRRAWIDDHDFEVNHLENGPFTVLAESERLGLSSTLENVRLGSKIEIQFKARPAQPK